MGSEDLAEYAVVSTRLLLDLVEPVRVVRLCMRVGFPRFMRRIIVCTVNPTDLAMIRDLYGSRAQTLINALLAFDGFLAWYFHLKQSVDHDCELSVREAHALENCRRAIDMHEIYERCAIRKHGSFMPHGAIFKTTRDILKVGDIWRYQFNKVMGQLGRVPFLTCPNDAATYVKVMLICPELMCWKDLT